MKLEKGKVHTDQFGTATQIIREIEPEDPPDVQGSVATWFLYCPNQSPAWSNFLFEVIHLRPIEGVRDATIVVPNSTHQVLLFALNPDKNPVPDDISTWQFMTPLNVMEQIQLPDDESAKSLAEQCVLGVVKGTLPAEPALSGAVEPWRTVLLKTAAHKRGEPHAP